MNRLRFHPAPAPGQRPVVAGFGPAGIFCAYLLARAGFARLFLSAARRWEKRRARVDAFFSGGALDESANIQFGEGGAGHFLGRQAHNPDQ